MLEWLEKRGILPNQIGANLALSNGDINVLDWLFQREIRPDRDTVRLAYHIDNPKPEIILWLISHRLLPRK